MGKEHSGSSKHITEKRRIKNAQHNLELRLSKIKNENSKEAIKKSSPIGRKKEGFIREQGKRKPIQEIKLNSIQEKCNSINKEIFIQRKGYKVYFCREVKSFVNVKQCKQCKKGDK